MANQANPASPAMAEDKSKTVELFREAKAGNAPVLASLVEEGADVNAVLINGERPLLVAAKHGHGDVCEILVALGADLEGTDAKSMTPLVRACQCKHLDVVRTLLELGCDVNATISGAASAALMFAALKGNVELLNALLAPGGVDINAVDASGYSALSVAVGELGCTREGRKEGKK